MILGGVVMYILMLRSYITSYAIGKTKYTLPIKSVQRKEYVFNPNNGEIVKNWGKDIILVIPVDEVYGVWEIDDILIFRKYKGQQIKDNYIILQDQNERQRIAYFKGNSDSLDKEVTFDLGETLKNHKIIGVLEFPYKKP